MPNNTIQEGDTTVVSIPDVLTFGTIDDFEVMDGPNVVANAKFDITAKTLTLTYTDYPQTKSDINGTFKFTMRYDHEKYPEKANHSVEIKAGNEVIYRGTVDFTGQRMNLNHIPSLKMDGWEDYLVQIK